MKQALAGLAALLVLVVIGKPAASSPDAAKHIEQRFLGANATHWFYFEFIWDFPTSYYEHTEMLRVCSRRKSDGALVDSTIVSRSRHHRDPSSLQPLPNESRQRDAFDLAAYMHKHAIHFASEAGIGQAALMDSTGFYIQGKLKRILFSTPHEMLRQLPTWTTDYAPVIRSTHRVDDSWNRDPKGRARAEEYYFVVEFGSPGGGSNWGRFIVYAQRQLP